MNNFFILNKKFKNIAWLLVGAMFFIGDRILKNLALNLEEARSLDIFGSWLKFRLAFNPYIAFSLPMGGQALNIIITIIIVVLAITIYYLIFSKNKQNSLIIPLTFILFGAISNLLDRYCYGAVVDYFDLRYFTILNLADIMISIGVIMILIYNIQIQKKS